MSETLFNPNNTTRAILARALELVESVPYQVSARWLFYRLLQEGYYSKKSDYKNKFIKATAAARRAFWDGWRPDTLADETREAIIRGSVFGPADPSAWLRLVSERLACKLDKWQEQPRYVELWFEARAMTDQFKHYTEFIPLRPMGGQPSIPFKWDTAKHLERVAGAYGVPLVVLYFGDLDEAGETIAETVERDVREWCAVDFEFINCGLTREQVARYGVPANPEKPGEYQWEALPDEGAREIIETSTAPFLRHGAFSTVEAQEDRVNAWLPGKLRELAAAWEG